MSFISHHLQLIHPYCHIHLPAVTAWLVRRYYLVVHLTECIDWLLFGIMGAVFDKRNAQQRKCFLKTYSLSRALWPQPTPPKNICPKSVKHYGVLDFADVRGQRLLICSSPHFRKVHISVLHHSIGVTCCWADDPIIDRQIVAVRRREGG